MHCRRSIPLTFCLMEPWLPWRRAATAIDARGRKPSSLNWVFRISVRSRAMAALVVLFVACPVSVKAANSGLDTPTGAPSLPFSVEGVEAMRLVTQNPGLGPVYLGVGLQTPQAPLDVNGGIRGSGASVIVGDSCSPEGMLGYDLAHHESVYCNGAQWASSTLPGYEFNGPFQCSAGASTCVARCSNQSKHLLSGGCLINGGSATVNGGSWPPGGGWT